MKTTHSFPRKLLCTILSLTLLFALIPAFGLVASAAGATTVADVLRENLPLVTYASPASGASRVYSYSSSSLSTKTTGYYIDSFIDTIVILKVSADGKAVYVKYPSSTASSGYRTRWFALKDIVSVGSAQISERTAGAKKTVYRLSSASRVTSCGYIAKGDACVSLGTRSIGAYCYKATIYPIASSTVNKTSGVSHKLAWERVSNSAPVGGEAIAYETKYSSSTGFRYLTSLDGKAVTEYSSVFYTYNSSGSAKSTGGNYNVYRYAKVGSSYKDVAGAQCCGYARWVQLKLYGCQEMSSASKFSFKYSDIAAGYSAAKLQSIVENCGAGAHIRTLTRGHSLIILAYDDDGLTTLDANSDGANGIRVRTWTYDEFVDTYANRGIDYVAVYTG